MYDGGGRVIGGALGRDNGEDVWLETIERRGVEVGRRAT